jgi:pimeloyl-ACP methyl ester carboxylesterase
MRGRLTLPASALALWMLVAPTGGDRVTIGADGSASAEGLIARQISIGDRDLHLVCNSASRSAVPTVIFEAGAGADSRDFLALLTQLGARSLPACAYDRAGSGQSDPPPAVVTAEDDASDLHEMLSRAGVRPPYVLAGQSLGGWLVRVFTARFPDEVVGIVFIDAAHPDQAVRFLAALPPPRPDEDPRITQTREILDFTNRHPSDLNERIDLIASAAQTRATHDLGDRPVLVLTKGTPEDLPHPYDERLATAWLAMQLELASLSTHGQQRTIEGASHDIHLDRPDAVLTAVEDIVAASSAD